MVNPISKHYGVLLFTLTTLMLSGCSESNADKPIPIKQGTTNIQWTSYGIPHISAKNYTDLGEGLGYVMAQNRLCNILEGIVTAKGTRAKYFGAGIEDSNINSDFAYLHLRTYERAQDDFSSLPSSVQDMMMGYAKGFNHWLKNNNDDNQGCSSLKQNITHFDMYALNLSIDYWGFIGDYISQIGSASMENFEEISAESFSTKLKNKMKGSNGWAIGKSLSSSGKGMLLSNTHLNHSGRFQWYEAHLTIPDELNVYGGFLPGFITPALGFNDSFAWTHTWSASLPGTFYYLVRPDESDLSQYIYDGQTRHLESFEYSIEVKQSDDSSINLSRVLFNSHYGPVVGLDELARVVVARDAPSIDSNIAEYWMKLAKSKDVEEAVSLNESGFRTGSQNIIMADDKGRAFYGDMSAVPAISTSAWQEIYTNPERYQSDVFDIILDGSNPIFDWQELVVFDNIPKRYSDEYVQNANESAWLANISQPIIDFSVLYGEIDYQQSPRTRLSLKMLESLKAAAKKVTMADLELAMGDKSLFLAELTKNDLVQRCTEIPQLSVDGQTVDLTQACDVLRNWNMKAELNSVGAIIFREYAMNLQVLNSTFGCEQTCWQTPFDPLTPIATPTGLPQILDPNTDRHLISLATAVESLEQAGIDLNAELGAIQKLVKGDKSIPIAGGYGDVTGSFSTVSVEANSVYSFSGLNEDGYSIDSGDGFVFLSEFNDKGIKAKSILLYSQANAPDSPHYFDQAALVEQAKYKDVRFTPREINEDPNLTLEVLSIE